MDIGRTEKQFEHRCQTFARAGKDTRGLLLESFDMRSDTEHLNPWDDAALRDHFRTEAAIAAFWKITDDQRRALWGKPVDIAHEPLVQKYDQWERATVCAIPPLQP
jgi:hypothetical protein